MSETKLINMKIDDRDVQVPAGTLVIEATRRLGIEVPSFCYYPGLALQAACRMCLVEVEKMPKLQTACTLVAGEGMAVRTNTQPVRDARKFMLEFLLSNHPLDCPVCDKGGECELQDMVFRYGADSSRFTEEKIHRPEEKWSDLVYYDAPRCILCYRCVRVCDEGMDVKALGVGMRGAHSIIIPNEGDHLDCEECGMCIDICPVGALTSGSYRYKTRPWEMEHIGTICTHCSNGCKTTLGVRNDEIIRGNNRDRSGINGEFLCIKGRYAFDFTNHPERLQSPMIREGGQLKEVSWSQALKFVATRFNEIKQRGGKFGVIGSTRTTNEENYYLQKFARLGLGTNNIDHHRTGDVVSLVDALSGRTDALATSDDFLNRKAVLIIGADLSVEQPFLAFQARTNQRLHGAHVYVVTTGPVREDQCAAQVMRAAAGSELGALEQLREALAKEPELVVVFGDSVKGDAVKQLVAFGDSLGIPVRYCCLVDYSNSRGAMDMGLLPDLLPGYKPAGEPGVNAEQMIEAIELDALWVVGSNPLEFAPKQWRKTFLVVQEMFMTETAQLADVILPAASAYEKNGTVTNVCGEVQRLKKALNTMGTKPDLEIMGLIGREMGLAQVLGPWFPEQVFEEIRANVHGYNVPLPVLVTGGAAQAVPVNGRINISSNPDLIQSEHDTLFTSGNLGKYSKILNSVLERRTNVEPVNR